MTGERWAAKYSFLQHKESLQGSIPVEAIKIVLSTYQLAEIKPFWSQQYLYSCFHYANDLNLIGVLTSMQTNIIVWGKKIHTHWNNFGRGKTMLAYMSVSFFYGYVYTLRLYSAKQTISAMAKIVHIYKREEEERNIISIIGHWRKYASSVFSISWFWKGIVPRRNPCVKGRTYFLVDFPLANLTRHKAPVFLLLLPFDSF